MRPARKGPENTPSSLRTRGRHTPSMRPARKGPENSILQNCIFSIEQPSMRPARKGPENTLATIKAAVKGIALQ